MTTRITSSDCGCYTVDGEQKLWCAHHVSGMQETIKARERSITDLRYRVRELEKEREGLENDVQTQINVVLELVAERDEWRDKAERLEGEVADKSAKVIQMRNERDEWKAKAEAQQRQREAWQLRAERKDIRISALENATHYCCMHMRWETREGAEV